MEQPSILFWQIICFGRFTKKEAEIITISKYPDHQIRNFTCGMSEIFDGYYTTTWMSESRELLLGSVSVP